MGRLLKILIPGLWVVLLWGAALPARAAGEPHLRVAVTAAVVGRDGLASYQKLLAYLERRTNVTVETVSDLSYRTINGMLRDKVLDVGFICGLPYVALKEEFPGLELLAAPVPLDARYRHQPIYFSDLIVRKDSPLRTLDDLRGKRLVYNSDFSNSGYNMPRQHLIERGLTKGYFGSTVQSGSHDDSVAMVAKGEADATFVDSLVLEDMQRRNIWAARQVRVIASLGPAPAPPVVVSPALPLKQREALRQALTTMKDDPEGKKILHELGLESFVRIEDKDYRPIRDWLRQAKSSGFMVIR